MENALAETPLMAPALTPSGRPPDIGAAITTLTTTDGPITTPLTSDASPMVVEPISSAIDCSVPKVTTQSPISYARALAGAEQQGTLAVQTWTPVGENDLVPGQINGEPYFCWLQRSAMCSMAENFGSSSARPAHQLHCVLFTITRVVAAYGGNGDNGFGRRHIFGAIIQRA
ncbi:unnamed protein product [Linum trigynum]|uniref:Uncharacterized protein n=1 Tax=Linum trigynum TaxID=586398 RepID=A0AAV2CNH9_9ROSI